MQFCNEHILYHSLDRLQNDTDENIQTIPTIGFNVEVLQYKNIKFQVSRFYLDCFLVENDFRQRIFILIRFGT